MNRFFLLILMVCSACNNIPEHRNVYHSQHQRKVMDLAIEQICASTNYRLYRYEMMVARQDERAKPYWQAASAIWNQALAANTILNEMAAALGKQDETADARKSIDKMIDRFVDTATKHIVHVAGASRASTIDSGWRELQEQMKAVPRIDWQYTSADDAIQEVACLQLHIVTIAATMADKLMGKFELPHGCVMDEIDVIGVANKDHIGVGEEYIAEMQLVTVDRSLPYRMFVNGKEIPVESGRGTYHTRPTRPGTYTWVGLVELPMADGTIKQYKSREFVYRVGNN